MKLTQENKLFTEIGILMFVTLLSVTMMLYGFGLPKLIGLPESIKYETFHSLSFAIENNFHLIIFI